MALALNNLKRVDMPLNKETKPNLIMQDKIKYYFWVFGVNLPGIVPQSPATLGEHYNDNANMYVHMNYSFTSWFKKNNSYYLLIIFNSWKFFFHVMYFLNSIPLSIYLSIYQTTESIRCKD